MRLAIIVQNFPPHMVGGTELQAEQLAKRLSIIHDVTVFTKHYGNQKLVEKRDNYSIKRVKFIDSSLHAVSYLSFSRNCSKAIVAEKPFDFIIGMMLVPSGFIGCLVKKKMPSVKVISWIRGGDWYFAKRYALGRKAISFVSENSDLILAQTEIIKQQFLQEYSPRKIEVLGNGIELSDKTSDGKFVLFVGNLNKRKGVEFLIYAMKDLKYECAIIGDGKERKNLEQLSSKNVKFLGHRSQEEIERYMQKAAVLVLPAVEGEGLPNVILEAMNVGLPVIATNIAGIPDIVNEKNGFLVKPYEPDAIRKCIENIMEDKKLRKSLSEGCKQTVKRYEWANITGELENYFKIT